MGKEYRERLNGTKSQSLLNLVVFVFTCLFSSRVSVTSTLHCVINARRRPMVFYVKTNGNTKSKLGSLMKYL